MIRVTKEIKDTIEDLFSYLQPYCISIYLGGSSCQEYIENMHDIDFICFADKPVDKCNIRMMIDWYKRSHKLSETYDFIQIRDKCNEERAYGSYINKMMVKLIGEDIEFNFDIINKDREEYKKILKETSARLIKGTIKNNKRWYQIYQGLCIMNNRSYILSEEQIKNLNTLHDEKEGSKELINKMIEEIELWQI